MKVRLHGASNGRCGRLLLHPGKVVVSAVPGEAEAILPRFGLDGAGVTMRLDAGTAQAMVSTVNKTLERQRAHRTTAH